MVQTSFSTSCANQLHAHLQLLASTLIEGFVEESYFPMKPAAALSLVAGVAADLKLTWSDCGAGSTHAKISSFTPDTLPLGQKTTLTGTGALDEAVTGATFDLSMTGSIGTLVHCTGDASASKTCSLPLGTGSLTFDAMSFPLAPGNVPVKVDLSLAASIPASLQTTTAQSKDKPLPIQ